MHWQLVSKGFSAFTDPKQPWVLCASIRIKVCIMCCHVIDLEGSDSLRVAGGSLGMKLDVIWV